MIWVDIINGNDGNSGASPATAFQTVQAAFAAATSGQTIEILPGYYPAGAVMFTGNKNVDFTGHGHVEFEVSGNWLEGSGATTDPTYHFKDLIFKMLVLGDHVVFHDDPGGSTSGISLYLENCVIYHESGSPNPVAFQYLNTSGNPRLYSFHMTNNTAKNLDVFLHVNDTNNTVFFHWEKNNILQTDFGPYTATGGATINRSVFASDYNSTLSPLGANDFLVTSFPPVFENDTVSPYNLALVRTSNSKYIHDGTAGTGGYLLDDIGASWWGVAPVGPGTFSYRSNETEETTHFPSNWQASVSQASETVAGTSTQNFTNKVFTSIGSEANLLNNNWRLTVVTVGATGAGSYSIQNMGTNTLVGTFTTSIGIIGAIPGVNLVVTDTTGTTIGDTVVVSTSGTWKNDKYWWDESLPGPGADAISAGVAAFASPILQDFGPNGYTAWIIDPGVGGGGHARIVSPVFDSIVATILKGVAFFGIEHTELTTPSGQKATIDSNNVGSSRTIEYRYASSLFNFDDNNSTVGVAAWQPIARNQLDVIAPKRYWQFRITLRRDALS